MFPETRPQIRTILALAALLSSPVWASRGPFLDVDPRHRMALESDGDTGAPDSGGAAPCVDQRLEGGVELPANPDLYTRWTSERSWGTERMVDALTEAAEELAYRLPNADRLVVGDISRRHGGSFGGHITHRGGIDADLGLYWGNGRLHQGWFPDIAASEFDMVRNWAMIDALLGTGQVDYILLDIGHIRRLKRWTVDQGILSAEEAQAIFPARNTPRIWELEGIVRHAPSHAGHLHVRVRCN